MQAHAIRLLECLAHKTLIAFQNVALIRLSVVHMHVVMTLEITVWVAQKLVVQKDFWVQQNNKFLHRLFQLAAFLFSYVAAVAAAAAWSVTVSRRAATYVFFIASYVSPHVVVQALITGAKKETTKSFKLRNLFRSDLM